MLPNIFQSCNLFLNEKKKKKTKLQKNDIHAKIECLYQC